MIILIVDWLISEKRLLKFKVQYLSTRDDIETDFLFASLNILGLFFGISDIIGRFCVLDKIDSFYFLSITFKRNYLF